MFVRAVCRANFGFTTLKKLSARLTFKPITCFAASRLCNGFLWWSFVQYICPGLQGVTKRILWCKYRYAGQLRKRPLLVCLTVSTSVRMQFCAQNVLTLHHNLFTSYYSNNFSANTCTFLFLLSQSTAKWFLLLYFVIFVYMQSIFPHACAPAVTDKRRYLHPLESQILSAILQNLVCLTIYIYFTLPWKKLNKHFALFCKIILRAPMLSCICLVFVLVHLYFFI